MTCETKAKLQADIKEALKAGQKEKLGVLRLLFTEVRNAEINDLQTPGRDRTEAEAIAVLQAYQKSMIKTLAEYPLDRQAPLKFEIAILAEYLPKQMSLSEVQAEILVTLKTSTERNFGALMKIYQPQFAGRTDGKTVSEAIKAALTQI